MANMAKPTAAAAAKSGLPRCCWQYTPILADIRWPPMTGHGCDSAPWGTAKISTAEAPAEATMKSVAGPVR